MKYIVITLPAIDYRVKGYGPFEQRLKLYEEIEELRDEAESKILDTRKLLAEYLDVGQMIAGLIRSQAKDTLAGKAVDMVAFDVFEKASTDHLKKMERYAEERGWAILSGNRELVTSGIGVDRHGRPVHPLSYNNAKFQIK